MEKMKGMYSQLCHLVVVLAMVKSSEKVSKEPGGADALSAILDEAARCRKLTDEECHKLRTVLMSDDKPTDTNRTQTLRRYYLLKNMIQLFRKLNSSRNSLERSFINLQIRRVCREMLNLITNTSCKCVTTGSEVTFGEYETVLEDNPLDSSDESLLNPRIGVELIDFDTVSTKQGIREHSSGSPGPSILRSKLAMSPPQEIKRAAIRFTPGDHPSLDAESPEDKEFAPPALEFENPYKLFTPEPYRERLVSEEDVENVAERAHSEQVKTDLQAYLIAEHKTEDGQRWRVRDIDCNTKALSVSSWKYELKEGWIETPAPFTARTTQRLRVRERHSTEKQATIGARVMYCLTKAKHKSHLAMVQAEDLHVVTCAPLVPRSDEHILTQRDTFVQPPNPIFKSQYQWTMGKSGPGGNQT